MHARRSPRSTRTAAAATPGATMSPSADDILASGSDILKVGRP
jgi:hypothetical protein